MGSGGQRRLLVLLLAAASLLWVPGQGQPRGERGGGGCALPAGQYRAGQSLFAGAGGVPGQAFAPAGLGEPWRRASRPRRAEPVRGPCWAARRTRGRRRGGGGRPAVRQCCPPRCHALPCAPPPSFISPLPPHLHVLQPPPPPPPFPGALSSPSAAGGHSARPPPGPPTPFVGAERRCGAAETRGRGRPRRHGRCPAPWGGGEGWRAARAVAEEPPVPPLPRRETGPQPWGSRSVGGRGAGRPEGCLTLSLM